MSTKKATKTTVVALAKQLIAGTAAHLANVPTVTLAGRTVTPAELTTQLNRVVTLRSDVDTARAATKARLADEKTAMPPLRTLMSALVAYVKAAHAGEPDVLAAFGIHPKVRAPLTVEAKAAAAAKRASARLARHTMGPVAKMEVKGDVTGVTVTPVTAPKPVVTPATPVTPAPHTTS